MSEGGEQYVGVMSGIVSDRMSNYSSEWNTRVGTRVEYQGVHGGVNDGNKVMGHVGMCEDTTSERELRKRE